MAYIEILDYTDIGTGGVHEATSWQFAKDAEFTKIIAESLNDKVNVKIWHNPLPKLSEDGDGYYADLTELYARVKIHVNGFESDWYVLGPADQNKQKVVITEKGKDPIYTDSDTIGMV